MDSAAERAFLRLHSIESSVYIMPSEMLRLLADTFTAG